MFPQSHPTRDASCAAPCCPALWSPPCHGHALSGGRGPAGSVWHPGFPWLAPVSLFCSCLFPPRWRNNRLAWEHRPQPASGLLQEHAAPGHGFWQLFWVGKRSSSISFTSRSNQTNTKDNVGRDLKRSFVRSPVQEELPLSLGLYSPFQSKPFYH